MSQTHERNPVEELADDFLRRHREGECPAIAEYAQRHPDLAEQIRELFPALLLLEAAAQPQREPPAAQAALPAGPLGDFRILREVGRGGMGVVYEAVQESLGRHVALKVLSAEAAAEPRRLERFLREARSAARLHHTQIVPVFEVGSANGVHYYAMQFIAGRGLDQVLRELRRLPAGGSAAPAAADPAPAPADGSAAEAGPELSTPGCAGYYRAVARVGLQAAEALAHAHAQGVLHRDIKPANLLLDERGEVWVTDFGLARQEGSDLTRVGDVVGTLRYMAPERLEGRSDARGDVYSLGLTLYELLTLRTPFAGTDDHARLVRRVAQEAQPAPRRIDPRIPRDLETVVQKATARDPAHRYATAAEFAEDLGRFLADQPVRARRVSAPERLWRWCRRNPALASAAGLAAVALLATLAVSVSFAVYQRQAAERLNAALVEARQQQSRAEASFRQARDAVDQYLLRVSDSKELKAHGLERLRRQLLETAQGFYQRFLRERGGEPGLRYDLALAYRQLASVSRLLEQHGEAEKAYAGAVALLEDLVREYPEVPEYQSELARAHVGLGMLYGRTDRPGAEAEHRRVVEIRERLVREHPETIAYRSELGRAWQALGVHLRHAKGRLAEAEEAYRHALDVQEALVRDQPGVAAYRSELAGTYGNLAIVHLLSGRNEQAEEAFGRAVAAFEQLAQEHPAEPAYPEALMVHLNNLGALYYNRGRTGPAEEVYRRAADIAGRLSREHPDLPEYQRKAGFATFNLALTYRTTARPGEAEKAYRQALVLQEALVRGHADVPLYQSDLAKTLSDLGLLHQEAGRFTESDVELRRALAILEPLARSHANPEYQRLLATALLHRGVERGCVGRSDEAKDAFRRALDALARLGPKPTPDDSVRVARCHDELGVLASDRGQAAEAADRWTQAGQALDALVAERPDFASAVDARRLLRLHRAAGAARAGRHAEAARQAEGEVREPFPAGGAYAAARVFALCSAAVAADSSPADVERRKLAETYADRALDLLRSAAADGYPDAGTIERDKALKSLKPSPKFRHLLNELKSKRSPVAI
jgi:serine/threonine protein kinase